MALYALGDLHLSFQADKSMEVFGKVWKNHERKIEKYVNRVVKPEDTLVLTGDHSWGRRLEECREDLAFIERLPGRKILLRGNHDMFWDAKKTGRLNEEYQGRLFFLQNNFAVYEDYALVGTKGFTFEGPFYLDSWGRVIGWDEEREWQAKKLVDREMERLRISLNRRKGRDTGNLSCSFITRPPYSGGEFSFHQDGGGISGFGCGLLPLPRKTAVRGQHPGKFPRHSLYAGVRGLPRFSSGTCAGSLTVVE